MNPARKIPSPATVNWKGLAQFLGLPTDDASIEAMKKLEVPPLRESAESPPAEIPSADGLTGTG